MMKKKLLDICTIFIVVFAFAQGKNSYYPNYPADKNSYVGGETAFYTDFHKVLIEKKLKPCENKKEIFVAKILIDEKGNTRLINEEKQSNVIEKNFWNTDIYENRCTIQLVKEVLPNLESWKWVPAKINGEITPSITQFMVNPNNLFSDKFLENGITESQFPGGIKSFRDKVSSYIDIEDFVATKGGKINIIVTFSVNINGEIDEIYVLQSSGSPAFDEKFVYAIGKVGKKKWIPAKVYDHPIKSKFKFPFSVNF
jgi:TonB family protein